jgi:hypothetical protein
MDVSGQLHAPVVLPLGNSPRYPLNRRLGETQSRYALYGEKNISFPLLGIEPRLLIRPALSLVAIPTDLSRLPENNVRKNKTITFLLVRVIRQVSNHDSYSFKGKLKVSS